MWYIWDPLGFKGLIWHVILGMRGHCKFVYKYTSDDVEDTSNCGCALQGSGKYIAAPTICMSLTSAANVTKFLYQLGILLLQEDPISIRVGAKYLLLQSKLWEIYVGSLDTQSAFTCTQKLYLKCCCMYLQSATPSNP
jgi:hypothetical protein